MANKKKPSLKTIFLNGILGENPTFRLVLGVCPTLAVTTSAQNGLGMGLAVIFVLTCANCIISALRNIIPDKVRIPSFVILICSFTTLLQMFLQGYVPSLYHELGLFLPLIVVNCIILARAEAFAQSNAVVPSIVDGLGMGVGYTISLTLIASIREIIGSGTLFGLKIMPASYQPMLLVVMAPGAFITFGLLLGAVNAVMDKIARNKAEGSKKA